MAKIKKYKNKKNEDRYEFQIYGGINPKTGRKTTTRRRGFKTRRQAITELDRLEAQVEETGSLPTDQPQKEATYQEVFDLWFEQYKHTVKESTWHTAQLIYNRQILPKFGKYKIKYIDMMQVQKVVNAWFEHGYHEYQMYISYASRIFTYAERLQIIDRNPAKLIIVPKNTIAKPNTENYYTGDELKRFLAVLSADESRRQPYTFFRLAAFSGMRKSEILALTWSDVNFKDCSISVSKTLAVGDKHHLIIQPPKTQHSIRTVFLDHKTVNVLRQWRGYLMRHGFQSVSPDSLIFTGEQGQVLQTMAPNNWLHKIIKQYGFKKVTVHAFRHTYATLAVEAGVTPKALQSQLGHTSIKTTMDIYTATTKNERNKATDLMANYLGF
ncbi:integrase [Secundilactobacillus pentosiphilus]|uniref:Integrase n=1 Tax=Secundilactobacillus pentosiphilus TaxID=1714682 RepID=A0A1Z5IZJ3_9LACO|nr:site-specific integrase [Secundilactobacillus pentosiphilus]GAX06992.1 integrase [Secundilactobacillus pentosiphilus]